MKLSELLEDDRDRQTGEDGGVESVGGGWEKWNVWVVNSVREH